jgi:hypothetical protein
MKSIISLFALMAAIVLIQAYARTAELSGSTHVGTVESVFVEQYPGIYVDRDVAQQDTPGPAWVHVKFSEPLEDGRTFAIAMLPADMRAKTGDRVEMRFADSVASRPEASLDHNLVISVLPGYGTVAAVHQSD